MVSSQKLMDNPSALTGMVRRIALAAGGIVMSYFEGGDAQGMERKDDGSPVTLADREAEIYIQKALADILPDVPMIGEETVSQGTVTDLSQADYFWLVDPLDGTREFIKGGNDFTVNIALIHKGEPVLGVVYVPAQDVLYAGYGADTAVRWSAETDKDKSIAVRKEPPFGLTVVASAHHGDRARLDEFLQGFKIEKVIKRGSSLKICSIAEGKADLYPRFGPTCEWDTAAAHAVLRAAGGVLTDTDGKELRYGGARPGFLNPEFIAASFAWWELSED